MSLILPEWIAHIADEDKKKKATIFSLHVHPDGSRLATGGLDCKIRIWATEPILNPAVEKMEGANKLLTTLDRHGALKDLIREEIERMFGSTGNVLVVRWSHSGKYLASGADDKIAFIWILDTSGTGSGSFGSSTPNIENWKPHRRLPAHDSDIVDIAWSAEDDYVATVGLDSIVYIWSGSNFEKIRKLEDHNGFVKGVVWDPLGQYLASQSDDKSLIVWRTDDWGVETVITEPFEGSPASTFFRRPSWSPDGGKIIASNAMSGPIFTARMIERSNWRADQNLVGHENSVVVAAYSPVAFKAEPGAIGSISTVFALGSLDQSVSIWKEGKGEPLLVAKDLFERGVMDLSWSSDGMTLYACSADGAIAVFNFDSEVLGPLATSSELIAAQKKFGAVKPPVQTYMQQPPQAQMYPPHMQMQMQMAYGQPQMNGMYPPFYPMGMNPVGFPQGYPMQPPQIQMGSMPPPASRPTPASTSASQAPPGTKDRPNMLQARRGPDSSRNATPTSSQPGAALASAQGPGERLSQDVSTTRDGKRRIRPTTIGGRSDAGSERNSVPPPAQRQQQQSQMGYNPSQMSQMSMYPQSQTQQLGQQNNYPQNYPNEQVYVQQQAAYDPNVARQTGFGAGAVGSRIHPMLDQSTSRGQKRKASDVDELSVLRLAQAKGKDIKSSFRQPDETGAAVTLKLNDEEVYAVALPPVMSLISDHTENGILTVRNSADELPAEIYFVDLNGNGIWNDYSPVPCLLLTTTSRFSAVALEDSTLIIYTPSGRCSTRLSLDSPCARLESNGEFLIAISSSGMLYRWNAVSQAQLSPPISIISILSSGSLTQSHKLGEGENLVSLRVHSNGSPIIFTKSEMVYTFDSKSRALTCISQGWFMDYSLDWKFISVPDGDNPIALIEYEVSKLVQARNNSGVKPASSSPQESKATFQQTVTLRHYEARLKAALLLESKTEWDAFFFKYVNHLLEHNLTLQARELCQELLGPAYKKDSDDWEPKIFDWSKHRILLDVVELLVKSPENEMRDMATNFREVVTTLAAK